MRDPNKEYDVAAFKKLCEQTVQNLPENVKDKSVALEKRQELALEQLLANVKTYANSNSTRLGMEDMPRISYLEAQIIHVLEHDWSLHNFDNITTIREFVTEAIGKM